MRLMYYHKLQSIADDWFFKLNKRDIVTDEKFIIGDEVVVCKKCKACYKRSTWDSLPDKRCVGLGCNAVDCTLDNFTEDFFEINFGGRTKKKIFKTHEAQEAKNFIVKNMVETVDENTADASVEDRDVDTGIENIPPTFIIKKHSVLDHPANNPSVEEAPVTFIIKERHPASNISIESDDGSLVQIADERRIVTKRIVLYFIVTAVIVSGLSVGYYYLWNGIFNVNLRYQIAGIISLVLGIGIGTSACIVPFFKRQIYKQRDRYVKFFVCSLVFVIVQYILLFLLSWGMSAFISIWSN